jgi:hypothetical protein
MGQVTLRETLDELGECRRILEQVAKTAHPPYDWINKVMARHNLVLVYLAKATLKAREGKE